jgi:Cu-Zn family superoxide dismutase
MASYQKTSIIQSPEHPAMIDMHITGTSLNRKTPVIARAVIVHAKADDLVSQSSGDSGKRIGCGIIGVSPPPSAAR